MTTDRIQTSSRLHRGFTLIEVIVVLVIMSIMAAMIMPRLNGNDKREFRLAVDRVGDLLTMFAQRQSLGQKPVGILHDHESNSLELVVLDMSDTGPGAIPDWKPDVFVEPIKLPSFMRDTDVDIFADGDRYDAGDWPVSCEVGQARPRIEITLRGAGETSTLRLYPYGVSPVIIGDVKNVGMAREQVDLDSTGRSREDW